MNSYIDKIVKKRDADGYKQAMNMIATKDGWLTESDFAVLYELQKRHLNAERWELMRQLPMSILRSIVPWQKGGR